jgi:DHA1 family multidrug resistance protein-like MFS transporter
VSREGAGGEKRVLWSAALTSAPVEFLDFLLPLWAATQLGASAFEAGAIISIEAALSLCVRPLAGILSDRFNRSRVGAVGGILYTLSFLGYAATSGVGTAFAAAAVQGAGGALFWVAVRSRVGEESGGSRSYGVLLSWESWGAFFGFVVGFVALQNAGYRGAFLLGAAACALAAAFLFFERVAARRVSEEASLGTRQLWRRFWPLLALVCLTATSEAGVGLLLLLHLKEGFSVYEVAYVFVPGALMFVILPGYTHKITERLGRCKTMTISLLASAGLAFSLSFAPGPVVIAVLWALCAACFAAAIPVEQSTVAEAAGGSVGRSMGLYESAVLVGVVIGPVLFGALYGSGGWQTAFLAMAVVLLAGAIAVPLALQSLGLPEGPPPDIASRRVDVPPSEPAEKSSGEPDPGRAREERRRFYEHALLFAVGQAILLAIGESWPAMLVSGALPPGALWTGHMPEDAPVLMLASRIWCIVLLVDGVWSLSYSIFTRGEKAL